MKNSIFSPAGEVGRKPYALWGFGLAALKYNLDRLLAFAYFDRHWSIASYWEVEVNSVLALTDPDEARFYGSLLALALPFVWVGVCLTLRRLRSVGMPLWLSLLFFVPVLNLFLFVMLTMIPSRESRDRTAVDERPSLFPWLPSSPVGASALGALASSVLGAAGAALAIHGLGSYGWGLFVGIPFCSGLLAAVIVNSKEKRSLKVSIGTAVLSVLFIALFLLVLAFEGVICLAMVTPFAAVLAVLGGLVGHYVSRVDKSKKATLTSVVIVLPLLMGAEAGMDLKPPVWAVSTEIIIDAPPETVWENVVSFSDLPPPQSALLKTGVAYPIRARITGEGVGAVRYCEFSTGAFVEPITVWDAPKLLAFSVESQPRAMDEMSPYDDLHTPHLDGALRSHRGQFQLELLEDGRTRLVGTTWYENKMWPANYWKLWSDLLIHAIHNEVLLHIKSLSEDSSPGRS
jgi:uncharacterized membrane protein YhaH (DUF805 family)